MQELYDGPDREDNANDLAMDALMKLREEPTRYQPEKGKSLWGYLWMDVRGDVWNKNQQMKRRPRVVSFSELQRDDGDDVGEQDFDGNIPSDDPTPEEALLDEEDRRERLTQIEAVRQRVVTAAEEEIVFQLQYVEGVKATQVFAERLGVTNLPEREQAAHIQRIKDRLAKRIERLPKE
jgi:hypothetical protein